jgi:hypothetical protein
MRLARLTVPVVLVVAACTTATQRTPVPPTPTFSPTRTPKASASASPTLTPTTAPTTLRTAGLISSPSLTINPPPPPTPTSAPTGWVEVSGFPTYGAQTYISGITFANDQFVAVGSSRRNGNTQGRVWTSADGMTWTAQPDASFAGHPLLAVAHNGSDFYAFGTAPASVSRSADGQAWQMVDLPDVGGGELGSWTAFSGGLVNDATTSAGVMYAAGETSVTGGDIVCECAALWRSTNGTDWQQSTVNQPDHFNTIAVAGTPPFAVAIGNRSYIGDAVMYTSDFDTWNAVGPGIGEDGGFLDAAADATRAVAVGWRNAFSEAIALVTDGSTWTVHAIANGAVAEQVTSIPGGFVAVGTAEASGSVVALSWVSPDGATWQASPHVYDRPREDPGTEPGDDPFNHRTISSGGPGIVVTQTFGDGLHVWFAPLTAFGGAH